MELLTNKLKYSTAFITSLILKNNKACAVELSEMYPVISYNRFSNNRDKLVAKGLVSYVEQKERINDEYNDVNGVTNDEVRKIIYQDLTLMPKELNKSFPHISTGKFNAVRHWLPEIRIERYRKVASKGATYKDCDYKSKNKIRKLQAKLMAESGIFGLIPVLPHFDWLGEVFMNKLTDKNYYLGIANNKYVFKGASIKRELLGINGEMVFGDMLDVLKQYPSNSFAHIGMDFCGCLPIQLPTVEYAMENNLIPVGGYIFLTVKRVVRKVVNGYAKEFNILKAMNTPDTKLTDSDFANDELLKSKLGENYIIDKKVPYQTGSPMVFYAIKRIK